MVKYNPKSWFALIFHSYSRQIISRLLPALIFMVAYTTLVTYLFLDYLQWNFHSTTAVHSLMGIVLGLFLVFRVNSAYDRWWEGRVLWGSLVNNCRNLVVKIAAFLPSQDTESRNLLSQMTINLVISIKEHLRKGVKLDLLELEESAIQQLENKDNIPNLILLMLYKKINKLYKSGQFTGEQFLVLDINLNELANVVGGCERIKNTPIPYSYSMYIKKFIFTFTITLPFAFITEFGYWTVPIVLFIFFILVSVELIAEEIEDPFGEDINDLPTDDICDKIQKNVREILMD